MNVLPTTIVDLYTRQIAMDEPVRGILHYKKVEEAIAVVNALLACISIAGGVAFRVLSGGIAIQDIVDVNGCAVSGLVELQFEVGKVWSSFVTEIAVKRFLRVGDAVLESETWIELPIANRHALEAAGDGLRLCMDELRRRVRRVAQQEHCPSFLLPSDVRGDMGIITDDALVLAHVETSSSTLTETTCSSPIQE